MVKNPPANAGDIRDVGLIPGSGISPGEERGKALQDSCLENPMDGGAWWATVHRVAKSRTQLKLFNTHTKSQGDGGSVPVSFHSNPIIKKQKIGIHDVCVSRGTVWILKNRGNRRLLIHLSQ